MTDRISESDAGLYLLTIRITSTANMWVGALGHLDFQPGYYIYCGSARRGLTARVKRHASRRKKKRWHIDYLTCRRGVTVETIDVFPLGSLTECVLNAKVAGLPGAIQVRGFGCSDCRCASHLTFIGDAPPDLRLLKDTSHDTR